MPRARSLWLASACVALTVGGAAVAGCPGSSTPATYTPYTGLTLYTDALLGGLQCGTAPGDVYKYTAIVWRAGLDGGPPAGFSDAGDAGDGGAGAPLASGVWDCFTDAVLENLPATATNGVTFFVQVFGYTFASTLGPDGGNAVDLCPGGLGPNGASCPLQDPSVAEALAPLAQWATTCMATETEGAPVTAVCTPFQPIHPGTESGADSSAEAALTDLAADVPPLDALDGSAEAPTDAPLDVSAN